jgi:hypothetical protein
MAKFYQINSFIDSSEDFLVGAIAFVELSDEHQIIEAGD